MRHIYSKFKIIAKSSNTYPRLPIHLINSFPSSSLIHTHTYTMHRKYRTFYITIPQCIHTRYVPLYSSTIPKTQNNKTKIGVDAMNHTQHPIRVYIHERKKRRNCSRHTIIEQTNTYYPTYICFAPFFT